jgi:hypothetical protein
MVLQLRVATYRKAKRQRSKFMEKTFTYQVDTNRHYIASSDEYEYDSYELEYTVEDDDLKDAIVDILFDTYFSKEDANSFTLNQHIAVKKALKNFTDDNDNWENLAKDFEKELKEYFEEDALAEYKYRG